MRISIKEQILTTLQQLSDGERFTTNKNYIIIYNTNYFDSIFEGTSKHFNHIKSRLLKYTFEEIGKQDIIDCLHDIESHLQKNPKNTMSLKLDQADFDKIPGNVKISYRHMFSILSATQYIVPDFIDRLGNLNCDANDFIEMNGNVSAHSSSPSPPSGSPKLPRLGSDNSLAEAAST